VPIFVKIGQTVAEIWQFFPFFKRRPSAIFDFLKFEILTACGFRESSRITVLNVVTIGQTVQLWSTRTHQEMR